MKKVFIDALGCPKALVDAERMAYFLGTRDYSIVTDPNNADVIVVNTCGFIKDAKEESINTILEYAELKKQDKGLKLVATGCLVERYKDELLALIPEIDHATGVKDPSLVVEALQKNTMVDSQDYEDIKWTTERRLQFSGLSYAYLKISEGCNRTCSFCVIPSIRGPQRSRPIEQIVEEAQFLRDQGMEELILISEDTTSYGLDLYGTRSLTKLLPELARIDFAWIRIMYLYPEPEVLAIAEVMRDYPSIVPYIDIPLQHASPNILRSMRRDGSPGELLRYIESIRKILPDIAIRSSLILGYPGETDQDVEILVQFLKDATLDRVGFFAYSDEEGSRSFAMEQKVSPKITKERIAYVAAVQKTISQQRLSRFIGRTLECIDDGDQTEIRGKAYRLLRSPYDAPDIDGRVYVPWRDEHEGTSLFHVKITDTFQFHDLKGEIL